MTKIDNNSNNDTSVNTLDEANAEVKKDGNQQNHQFDTFISPEPYANQGASYPRASHNHPLMNQSTPQLTPEKEQQLIRYNHISYVLYLLSFFTAGLLWIIPIFMNYYSRREAEGTWLATHFDWQIKTFWYSLIMGVVTFFFVFFAMSGLGLSVFASSGSMAVGSGLLFVVAGFIFLVSIIWYLYRIARGWIALNDGRPIP